MFCTVWAGFSFPPSLPASIGVSTRHVAPPSPCFPPSLVSSAQPPPRGHRLLVMATTAVPYLLEELMLVQAFMVSLHVPQLQGGGSVKTVLRKLVPMSQVRRKVFVGVFGSVRTRGGRRDAEVARREARAPAHENIRPRSRDQRGVLVLWYPFLGGFDSVAMGVYFCCLLLSGGCPIVPRENVRATRNLCALRVRKRRWSLL